MADPDYLRRLERDLVDQGKLIEAGWVGLRIAAVPADASALQLSEMRTAFFAGAQHLFGSIMGILDDDAETTDDDLRRLTLIDQELQAFIADFAKRHGLPPRPR